MLENGLDSNMIFDIKSFKSSIGTLFGYTALKYAPEYKRHLSSDNSIRKHGNHLFNLYLNSAHKNGYIGHRNIHLRFFTEKTLVDFHTDFFEKKHVRMKNWSYVTYKPKEQLHKIADEVFSFIKTLHFSKPEDKNIQENDEVFSFSFDELMDINIRDRMLILAHSLGVKDKKVWVEINTKDNGFNRVYSLMTTIKSESRLGLIEYDVGTCQQAIMMNVVNRWEDFPLHTQLVHDKLNFRQKFMDILGCGYDEAKQHITAISNGYSLDYYKNSVAKERVKPFWDEANLLSKLFVETVQRNDVDVYVKAEELAKKADEGQEAIGDKRFYGILFHAYTYYERQIREAMKSCFSEPIYDVHDAVYSREVLDPKLLEKAVLEKSGFVVSIESSADFP